MVTAINRRTAASHIGDTLAKARVRRAWLFGSYARNTEAATSDLDMIVEFPKGRRYSLLDLAGLELELQSRLGMKVHLLTRPEIHKSIRPAVDREKKLIYSEIGG